MKTITCNDEAAPWSRSNHVFGTGLLPLSNNSNNNFFESIRTEIMANQVPLDHSDEIGRVQVGMAIEPTGPFWNIPVTRTVYAYFFVLFSNSLST
jgi:hypothetical protein